MTNTPLFFNSRREKISRSGVGYILTKYVEQANENGGHISEKIAPHCLRHSKAMHMVEAGINLIYIRDFLGHESIETTQVYAIRSDHHGGGCPKTVHRPSSETPAS